MYGVKAPKIKNIPVKNIYTCEGDMQNKGTPNFNVHVSFEWQNIDGK